LNSPGFIEEVVEDDESVDLDLYLQSILNMPDAEIEEKEKAIVGDFPNTYTLSKHVGERMIKRHRGDLPAVIVRPAIIGAAAEEPMPGWVDAVTAGTAIFLAGSLGVLKELHGNSDIIGDQIPVDYVADLIITASADSMNKNKLQVYHCGSSHRNPSTGWQTMRYLWSHIGRNPFEKMIDYPSFDVYKNKTLFSLMFLLKRKIPARGYYYLSRLIGNNEMKKQAEKYLDALDKCKAIGSAFADFTKNEWIYETFNAYELQSRLSQEDLDLFKIDIKQLNWKEYFPIFSYGMQKYLMKQETEPPFKGKGNFMNKRPRFLYDLSFIFSHGQNQKTRNFYQILKMLLNSERVRITIREIVTQKQLDSSLIESKLIKNEQTRVKEILNRMMARMSFQKMRILGYIIHKAYKSMYEMVVVDRNSMTKLKELNESGQGNVVYCPTHRSYVDFLVLSYVLYAHDIKVPHICAGEDFLNIAIVHTFLRNSGAFFMKRSFKDDPLYKSVFYEYVQQILTDGHSLEFFLEGTRARSGKMLKPKFGLLKILTSAFFSKKNQNVKNLFFVPISLNYSRVLEGETFPLELLGESKVKESLSRIVNAARFVTMNFGSIYVEVGKPINFKDYAQDIIQTEGLDPFSNENDEKLITSHLGYTLIYKLTQNVMIMPTAV